MSRVDVLAVMLGASLRDVADQRPDRASAMIEARAAVVELVEAAEQVAWFAFERSDMGRLRAALAKFTPEAGK